METAFIEISIGFGLAVVVAYLVSIFHKDLNTVFAILAAWFILFGLYIYCTYDSSDHVVRRPTVVEYRTCIEDNHCQYNRL